MRGAASTRTGGLLQVFPPLDDVDTTICDILARRIALRPCDVDAARVSTTETATDGRAFVRKRVAERVWSKGAIVATCVVFLDGNVLPKSSERAMRIESGLLVVANWRQTT